jgi:adenylate kinase family enzyme
MRKIFIIGIVASGKTTLAKRLSKQLNIPWYELDSIVHHQTGEGRYKRTPEEQQAVIGDIDRSGGGWIFEGVDRSSYRCLYEMADTIIVLDPPLWKRRYRIFARYVKQQLGIEHCSYKSDMKMLRMMYRWTRDFERRRPEFEARLQPYEGKIVRLSDSKGFGHE